MRLVPRWLWRLRADFGLMMRHECRFKPVRLVKTFVGSTQVGNAAQCKCRCGMGMLRSLNARSLDPWTDCVNAYRSGHFTGRHIVRAS